MSTPIQTSKRVTTTEIRSRKSGNGKIVAITAYDFVSAKLVDKHADLVLVGDSLGMVIQGEPNTLSVTLEDVIYHCRAVSKGLSHAHLVADMPFMTYQVSLKEAVRNAGRLLSEGRAEAVKLEGGVTVARTVERLVSTGIPVLGHIGLTPQSVHALGGYKIQGKTVMGQASLKEDARALEEAGAYAIVLEGIPAGLAREITESVKIPTIGIGAGVHCDGQILVFQDLLGMNPEFSPKFVKKFANLAETINKAVGDYASEVVAGKFPDESHSF